MASPAPPPGFIGQSNVTTRIRQLEAHLGVPLFVREGRRLSLAPAGAVLSDYAERLLELADQARAAVADAAPRGRLRLGSMESTAAARLPTRLAAFHQRYPDVQLELHTGATALLLAQLRAGSWIACWCAARWPTPGCAPSRRLWKPWR